MEIQKLEKLRSNENWLQWHFVIRKQLEGEEDLLTVCEGKLVCPEQGVIDYERKLKQYKNANVKVTVEKKPLDFVWRE